MNVLIMRRLQQRAKDEAAHVADRVQVLRNELQKILQQEAVILYCLTLAEQADDLASQYKPMVAGRYQCPCCALSASPCELKEQVSDAGRRRFECPSCLETFDFDLQLSH